VRKREGEGEKERGGRVPNLKIIYFENKNSIIVQFEQERIELRLRYDVREIEL